ncbi:MAG: flagellar assembly protein FliW [Gemmatimonadaceae bacterium]
MSVMAVAQQQEPCTISSDLLGPIQVPAGEVICFPGGLYGFPECRSFALVPAAREGLFWLQSAEYSALSFLLVDPFAYFPSYHIDLDDVDLGRLGTNDPQHILVLAIVTMPASAGAPCTANLHAPVVFNMRDRHAHQSIRPNDGYDIREPFFLEQPSASADLPA